MKTSLGKKFSCKITHETTLFFRKNNLKWMLTNDISIKTCLEKTKSMEKRQKRRNNTYNPTKKTLSILYERNMQGKRNQTRKELEKNKASAEEESCLRNKPRRKRKISWCTSPETAASNENLKVKLWRMPFYFHSNVFKRKIRAWPDTI